MYYMRTTEQYGRGLYASELIRKGTIITICQLLILSESDTKKVNETALQDYTFTYQEGRDCLVLGDGELFNHSDDSNTEYKLLDNKMYFIAKRDINIGEQLFINYKDDCPNNKNSYTNNLYK